MLCLLPIKTVCIPKGEQEKLSVRSSRAQVTALIRQITAVPTKIFLAEGRADLPAKGS